VTEKAYNLLIEEREQLKEMLIKVKEAKHIKIIKEKLTRIRETITKAHKQRYNETK